jgi:hypothetical protein
VGLERGPLSLVSTTEELIVATPVYKTEINGRGDPLRWPRDTLYPQNIALTSPTSGSRSVGIVRLRTKASEFVVCFAHTNHLCVPYDSSVNSDYFPHQHYHISSSLLFTNSFNIGRV